MHLEIQPLLNSHARSFALTLRLLPKGLREPLSLGYLLARASDTIADASGIPRERRLELLLELQGILVRGETLCWKPEFGEGKISESERELMGAVPKLMAWLEDSDDRAEIVKLWHAILKGQLFDLQRFGDNALPLSRGELEEYCYLVAGSVGETWTRLIALHTPQILMASSEEMVRLGIAYGKGLQLLNILRDRAADRELGRVYVDEADISAMLSKAVSWLSQGEQYCAALRSGRIRYGSELPLRLAQKTLDRIRKEPLAVRLKISRSSVYQVLVQTLPSLVLPNW